MQHHALNEKTKGLGRCRGKGFDGFQRGMSQGSWCGGPARPCNRLIGTTAFSQARSMPAGHPFTLMPGL
jgi:hypothetical protein